MMSYYICSTSAIGPSRSVSAMLAARDKTNSAHVVLRTEKLSATVGQDRAPILRLNIIIKL